MKLIELMKAIDYNEIVNRSGLDSEQIEISSLCRDSRKVCEGAMFVCISGSMSDGHDYVKNAYDGGCRVFVAEHKIDMPDDCFIIITGDTRVALAQLSAAFFGYPAKEMTVIGITGTKGKTTCSLLIYNVLNESGIPAGYIGSNGVH